MHGQGTQQHQRREGKKEILNWVLSYTTKDIHLLRTGP